MEKDKNLISIQKINRVGYLTLNKPPANGYEIDLLRLLLKTTEALNEENEIKVVVLGSSLEKFFCGGADIKVFGSNTTEQNKAMVKEARKVGAAINNSPKIFIAAINGHTLGGGLELAMACDIRLAAEGNYLLGLPEIKLGLIPGNGGTIRLIHLVGAGRAMELLLSGNAIQPEQALEYGLLNKIFPKESFEIALQEYARKLADGPSQAMSKIKQFINRSTGMNLSQGLVLEEQYVNELYETFDAQEGFKAFIEKRQPNFE